MNYKSELVYYLGDPNVSYVTLSNDKDTYTFYRHPRFKDFVLGTLNDDLENDINLNNLELGAGYTVNVYYNIIKPYEKGTMVSISSDPGSYWEILRYYTEDQTYDLQYINGNKIINESILNCVGI